MRLFIRDFSDRAHLLPSLANLQEAGGITSYRYVPLEDYGEIWYVVELLRLPQNLARWYEPDQPRGPDLAFEDPDGEDLDDRFGTFVYSGGEVLGGRTESVYAFPWRRCQGGRPTKWLQGHIVDHLICPLCSSLSRREDPLAPEKLEDLRRRHEDSLARGFFTFEELLPDLLEFVSDQVSPENSTYLLDADGELPVWADRYLLGPKRADVLERRRRVIEELLGRPRRT